MLPIKTQKKLLKTLNEKKFKKNNGDIINIDCLLYTSYLKYFNMGFFDIIVSNPPFFKVNRDVNFLNNLKQLSIARHEIEITLEERCV